MEPRLDLPANHVLAGGPPLGYRRGSLSPASTRGQIDNALAELPESWLCELGLSRSDLADRLKKYFQSILDR